MISRDYKGGTYCVWKSSGNGKSDGVECLQKLLKNLLGWESGYFLETHDT